MSTKHFCFLATAATALIAVATLSHAQAPDQRMDHMGHPGGHVVKASELIGLGVHAANNEEKGKIKDLMIGPNGRVDTLPCPLAGF